MKQNIVGTGFVVWFMKRLTRFLIKVNLTKNLKGVFYGY